jgi:hypothetical protein
MVYNYSIKVNLSEQDIYDLQNGKEFNWNWDTEEDENVIIKINLFQGEDLDE